MQQSSVVIDYLLRIGQVKMNSIVTMTLATFTYTIETTCVIDHFIQILSVKALKIYHGIIAPMHIPTAFS